MERSRLDMSHTVERRAEHAESGTEELREPFPRVRSTAATAVPRKRPADAGLTRRERKVKELLLRELKKGSDVHLLTYEEIQNLEKTLNVAWIDEQLGKMAVQMRRAPRSIRLASAMYGLLAVMNLTSLEGGGGGLIITLFWLAAAIFVGIVGPAMTNRSLRRKTFIYEALRELAGADEAGVTLSEAVEQADELITRIVDRELAAEAEKPAKTIGRLRDNA